MKFKVGDIVECISAEKMNRLKNGQRYTIKEVQSSYLYFKEVEGGFLHRRFRRIAPKPMDSSEYDDIMLAQDIYGKMEG